MDEELGLELNQKGFARPQFYFLEVQTFFGKQPNFGGVLKSRYILI